MTKISNEIQEFIGDRVVVDKLSWMYQNEECGYEKWFQHELAYKLAKNGHNVTLEKNISVNRVRSSKDRFQVDLVVRCKGQNKNVQHAIEIKVANRQTGALRAAIRDLVKVGKTKKSDWEFRSVTSIALVNSDAQGKYSELWSALEKNSCNQWTFKSWDIKNTTGKVYFLSWNQPPISATKGSYDEFLKFIIQATKDKGISTIQNGIKRATPKKVKSATIERSKRKIKTLKAS